jgi:uncharacterized tellurite resistance protein B-like protein
MFDIFKKKVSGNIDSGKKELNKDVDLKTAAAVLMVNIAYADKEFSGEEREYINSILKKDFKLVGEEGGEEAGEEVESVVKEAEELIMDDTNKWKYINKINREYSNDQKEELILKLWNLIYADDNLDKYEDSLIHSVVKMLHIPHKKMIELKVKAIEENK